MKQYIDLCSKVLNRGKFIENKRTGKKCLTLINADLTYDCSEYKLPILTTKKMAWKPAIAEMLGYGTLYLNSIQRSCDIPLGVPFNMIQLVAILHTYAEPGEYVRIDGILQKSWIV